MSRWQKGDMKVRVKKSIEFYWKYTFLNAGVVDIIEEEGVAQKKTAESDNFAKPSTGKRLSTFCIIIPPSTFHGV